MSAGKTIQEQLADTVQECSDSTRYYPDHPAILKADAALARHRSEPSDRDAALEEAARIAERHASVAIYTGPCVETAAEIRALKEAECDSGDGLGASSSALDAASAADQRTPVLAQERGRCAAGLQSKPASAEVPHADPAPSDGRGCDEQPRRVEAPGSTDTAAGDVLCVNCGLPGARAHPPWENAWHDERNECIRLLRSALATAEAERDAAVAKLGDVWVVMGLPHDTPADLAEHIGRAREQGRLDFDKLTRTEIRLAEAVEAARFVLVQFYAEHIDSVSGTNAGTLLAAVVAKNGGA